MTVGATLLREMLGAIEVDAELRERVRRLIGEQGPGVAKAIDYVDRHAAGFGPTEWRRLTREIPCFRVGRRLLVRRADLSAWIEAHRVARDDGPKPDSPAPEPDAFERALAEGRLRVVRPRK